MVAGWLALKAWLDEHTLCVEKTCSMFGDYVPLHFVKLITVHTVVGALSLLAARSPSPERETSEGRVDI